MLVFPHGFDIVHRQSKKKTYGGCHPMIQWTWLLVCLDTGICDIGVVFEVEKCFALCIHCMATLAVSARLSSVEVAEFLFSDNRE